MRDTEKKTDRHEGLESMKTVSDKNAREQLSQCLLCETPHLTSMDWTPSDSSSTQLFVSRGPSVMRGASAGDRASSSEGTMRLVLVSDAANTQKPLGLLFQFQ